MRQNETQGGLHSVAKEAALSLFAAALVMCWRKLWLIREERRQSEAAAMELQHGAEMETAVENGRREPSGLCDGRKRVTRAERAKLTLPEDMLDMLVDLGEEGEIEIAIPRTGIKSASHLRRKIAQVCLVQLGKARTPVRWKAESSNGGLSGKIASSEALAAAMSVTLVRDNHAEAAPMLTLLTNRTATSDITSATSATVMPT